MERHFAKDLETLQASIIRMAGIVEEAMQLSIKSLLTSDLALAQHIAQSDDRVNLIEIEIDHQIMDLLALQQPVARDLRLILAAQKINNDLERIGDHAVNIAQSAITFCGCPNEFPFDEISKMCTIAQSMLRSSIDSFIHRDPVMSQSVLEQDDQIDEMNRILVGRVTVKMKSHPDSIDAGIEIIRVSRNLERVADLATNIAEEVIFTAQARLVKHHAAEGAHIPQPFKSSKSATG